MSQERLQPTLWRTCRALANVPRLKILSFLFTHPDQHVTTVADALRLPLTITSEYLRILEARGMLECTRRGRWVHYSLSTGTSPYAAPIVLAIALTLKSHSMPIKYIFHTATAFTHPRRIQIISALARQSTINRTELRRQTGISTAALTRHLAKLKNRGFARSSGDNWSLMSQNEPLHKALLKVALLPDASAAN